MREPRKRERRLKCSQSYVSDEQRVVGSVCKYGYLHFDTFSEIVKEKITKFAVKYSLNKIEECIEAFSTEGRIDGRQKIIDE